MQETNFNVEEKLWTGPKFESQIDESKNFGEFCLDTLSKDPDHVMQINGDTDEGLTKGEIRRRTICLAKQLQKLECAPDKRIALYAKNHHNLTPLLISAVCIGSPLCPLDASVEGSDKILKRTEPTIIFCDVDKLPAIQKLVKDTGIDAKLLTVENNHDGYDSIESLLVDDDEKETFVCAKIEDNSKHAAIIACSSGSTGISKSIFVSHAVYFQAFLPENTNELKFISLSFSSLIWFSGTWSTLLPVFVETCFFTSQPFTTDKFFDLVEKYKVQMIVIAPCYLQAVIKSERCETADLSSLFVCFPTGNKTPSSVLRKMKEIIPNCNVVIAYGLTEVGAGSISMILPDELEEHPLSVGHLTRGAQTKIIDEQTGERCGINQEGEICVKSTIVPMGYFRDEHANSIAFDKEGFFMTGDVGYFDEEGRLYISGRSKEVFKVRQLAVWPAPLENAIQKHPAVRNVCVINVYDEELVTDLNAAVMVKNEQHQITEEEVYKLIAGKILGE